MIPTKISSRKAALLLCCLGFFLCWQSAQAGKISLEDDIADGYLDEYTKVEAAFLLSGISDTDSLPGYLDWYNLLLNTIRGLHLDYNDPIESARTVFLYLHSAWLKTYAEESTTLIDIVQRKEYNCVSATILYNLICEELGWSSQAFETPTHVYTVFDHLQYRLMVENTSTMGFDILKNLKAYSQYLARYYSQSEVLRIGLDRLYLHENSKGRVITNTELLGLLAYNRAYLARKNKDFKKAYDLVLLAQQFNRDSRSNIRFEIGLYYNWGKQLYEGQDYSAAFGIFADGYYRYPDNRDFRKNTLTSFYRAMEVNWQKKDWPESARLIDEIEALNILQKQDRQNIRQMLMNWLHDVQLKKAETIVRQVQLYLKRFGD